MSDMIFAGGKIITPLKSFKIAPTASPSVKFQNIFSKYNVEQVDTKYFTVKSIHSVCALQASSLCVLNIGPKKVLNGGGLSR